MTPEKTIYLTWKPYPRSERFVVGKLTRSGAIFHFSYEQGQDLEKAKQQGFTGYPAFPNFEQAYTQNVIESFGSRIPARSRTDFATTLRLWKIEDSNISDFDFLAATGGELATDHFRFVDPHPESGPTTFLSRVAGYQYHLDPPSAKQLPAHARLSWVPEDQNAFDPQAVRLDWQGRPVGYLTKLHARRVRQAMRQGDQVDVQMDHLGVNGVVNLAIARISIQPSKLAPAASA